MIINKTGDFKSLFLFNKIIRSYIITDRPRNIMYFKHNLFDDNLFVFLKKKA